MEYHRVHSSGSIVAMACNLNVYTSPHGYVLLLLYSWGGVMDAMISGEGALISLSFSPGVVVAVSR